MIYFVFISQAFALSMDAFHFTPVAGMVTMILFCSLNGTLTREKKKRKSSHLNRHSTSFSKRCRRCKSRRVCKAAKRLKREKRIRVKWRLVKPLRHHLCRAVIAPQRRTKRSTRDPRRCSADSHPTSNLMSFRSWSFRKHYSREFRRDKDRRGSAAARTSGSRGPWWRRPIQPTSVSMRQLVRQNTTRESSRRSSQCRNLRKRKQIAI